MEKIEEKRYNSLGFSPKLALFYHFASLFVNVYIAQNFARAPQRIVITNKYIPINLEEKTVDICFSTAHEQCSCSFPFTNTAFNSSFSSSTSRSAARPAFSSPAFRPTASAGAVDAA